MLIDYTREDGIRHLSIPMLRVSVEQFTDQWNPQHLTCDGADPEVYWWEASFDTEYSLRQFATAMGLSLRTIIPRSNENFEKGMPDMYGNPHFKKSDGSCHILWTTPTEIEI